MGKQADRIKKRRKDIGRPITLNFIRYALDGIRRERSHGPHDYDPDSPLVIRPLIHKIVLTDTRANWKADREAIWAMLPLHRVEDYRPKDDDPNGYQEKWVTRLKDGFLFIVYAFPKDYRTPYWMEIHVHERVTVQELKDQLRKIESSFPTAKVSWIDYTLDQYCYGPHEAQRLFWVEMRNLYVPHQRKAWLTGAKLTEWGDENRMNTAYRAGNVQVYERGPDNKKGGDHWQFEDVDRVRLEYTAKRARLLKKGINTIGDLIDGPRFHAMNRNIYRFVSFERSKKLPRHYDDYTTPGDKKKNEAEGNIEERIFGALQLEYNRHRKGTEKVPGIGQYVKDLYVFEPLKARLDEVMREYDKEWEKTR